MFVYSLVLCVGAMLTLLVAFNAYRPLRLSDPFVRSVQSRRTRVVVSPRRSAPAWKSALSQSAA
jgi:hypothetical protein